MLQGRAFSPDERDPNRSAPVLISQSAASRLWPEQDAIGRRFSRGERGEQNFEVVGIVTDARTTSLETASPLMVYAPYWWGSRSSLNLMIRTAADPMSIMRGVRRVLRDIDPEIAIGSRAPWIKWSTRPLPRAAIRCGCSSPSASRRY